MGDFLIRSAQSSDLADVFRLARHLDSYNLPADRSRLRGLIQLSERSFAGRLSDPDQGRYLFVLEDVAARRAVGCSLIIAKHGTPGMPHLYLTCFNERHTSRTLRRSVDHRCLRLGATEDGPTEVGGLVLLPRYRGRPERLGALLSHVRLLYIAARMERFQICLLAEYLPRFLKARESPFWEHLGRKFTGLSYREADRLSMDNKEFVLSLFPRGILYQDFFPAEVIDYLGEVGDPSKPAARLLRKVGFEFLQQIEPFDGGPYYGALTRSVTVIQRARQLQCLDVGPSVRGKPHMILSESRGRVRAVAAPLFQRGVQARLAARTAELLGLARKGWFWSAPFE